MKLVAGAVYELCVSIDQILARMVLAAKFDTNAQVRKKPSVRKKLVPQSPQKSHRARIV